MLGFIGKWASSKGMGRVPDLEGLSLNEARTAIANAGFNLGNETSIGNSGGANSSNNGKAKGRIDTGSLLQYELTIDFEYYSYVEPVVTPVVVTPVVVTPVVVTPVVVTPVVVTPEVVTPVVTLPALPTPTLSLSSSGYENYPNTTYANINVGNFDYGSGISYSSTMGTQNPEFPDEWNLSGLAANSSYTIFITASKAGFTSSTGSLTFTSHYVNPVVNPVVVTPDVVTPVVVTPDVVTYSDWIAIEDVDEYRCSGTTKQYRALIDYRRSKFINGVFSEYEYQIDVPTGWSDYEVNSVDCGYVAPVVVTPDVVTPDVVTPVVVTPDVVTPDVVTPVVTPCIYNGIPEFVPCPPNVCVYSNCGDFLGYTST
jgi:hypothetical protein